MTLQTNAFPQSFALSDKGLVGLEMGDTLKAGIHGLLPAERYPHPQRLSLWDENLFDYHFLNGHSDTAVSIDSIPVEDFFIGTSKRQVIAGIIFHVRKKHWKGLSALIDRVFGPARLGATSGEEGVTSRWKRYWYKDGISLLASTSVESDITQITITPAIEGHKPWLHLRY